MFVVRFMSCILYLTFHSKPNCLPQKYQQYVLPAVCRVYLDTTPYTRTSRKSSNTPKTATKLSERVKRSSSNNASVTKRQPLPIEGGKLTRMRSSTTCETNMTRQLELWTGRNKNFRIRWNLLSGRRRNSLKLTKSKNLKLGVSTKRLAR